MGDPPPRKPTARFASVKSEVNVAPPPRVEELRVATPIGRKMTPVAMPAPPPSPVEEDRQSYDDLEHVAEVQDLERQRAILASQLQDAQEAQRAAEREASRLRELSPTLFFPPPSMPPPAHHKPAPTPSSAPPPRQYSLPQKLTHLATGIGIFGALAWNAFNSYRGTPEKVEAVQARLAQSDQERDKAVAAATLERQRTLQALRAVECWGKQLRGASQRTGLDLPSLPPGGIRVLRLAPEDPNRPGAPVFIVEEKCSDFPKLPPETGSL